MIGFTSSQFREPKDPPLITSFLNNIKSKSIYLISKSDERKENALNLARKKFMSRRKYEDLLQGKAQEYIREKRLSNKFLLGNKLKSN